MTERRRGPRPRAGREGQPVPDIVVSRLPIYLRALARLREEKVTVVRSEELARQLRVTPAQIRKDLSYFGKFGKQGLGYVVSDLQAELKLILGLDRQWAMALVGVGRLGRAILHYTGFAPQGFRVVAVFDQSPKLVGKKAGRVVIQDIAHLEEAMKENPVDIGIVAVPAPEAQKVIDRLVGCGIKAILNYAPINAQAPPSVHLRRVDPIPALQSMTYYLKGPAQARDASMMPPPRTSSPR